MDTEMTDMPEDLGEEFPKLFCHLANGHWVEFACQRYWMAPSTAAAKKGQQAVEVEAVRIFSNEEPGSGNGKLIHEFRQGPEFHPAALGPAWEWLRDLLRSRRLYDYDSLEELLTDFADILATSAAETAVLHYERLPELTFPELFDRWDDSLTNDQTETEREEKDN
ncbi:MAG TPA: hypothetical protein VG796_07195 [Verrucomicrobiales bacterium]|nr:hypothetical protein [Verrucomicrobiales bacterium]